MFPDVKYFVKVIDMEAHPVCNTIMSITAIKLNEQEKSKFLPGIKPSFRLKSEVHFVFQTQVKEIITPADIIKVRWVL